MFSEERIKKEIQKRIYDFRHNYDKYRQYSEGSIESTFIEPLFRLLGWTEQDYQRQVRADRADKRGHADYAFKINDRIVFFLEVKRIGVPLEREADKQVISYALSKRVPFAVSTNFEEMKIFCVEQEDAINNKFRVFERPEKYITDFADLSFLSKDSFESGRILEKAQSEGRLKKRISIDKTLLDDLMCVRSLIANDIERNYPKKYDVNEKDEIVQRIIDRLIFIRKCEDVGINPDNLVLSDLKNISDENAYSKLKEIFKTYNEMYNSGLFTISEDNDCDKIKISGLIIRKLISHLYYSEDGQYEYNFDWIDADVLGQVYEQYLGKILAQTRAGKSKLKNGQAHRKEQGIYYTPTYVVDYIVKNTVGEYIKGKHTKTVQNIKILDPACGSGSFLIKAFDCVYDSLSSKKESAQRKLDSQGMYSVKTEILKNNIYGVDLDNKAVEITKLNLLLKAAEKNRKLPKELDNHIKQGNSLIDDENIAGLDAFKWEGNFQEGSFDVVIGNPPYVRIHEFDEQTKECFSRYSSASGQYDIYVLFIEQALKLLKDGGFLGFIVSNKFLVSDYGIGIRKFILSCAKIKRIVDVSSMKVFKDASVYPIIIILEKTNDKKQLESNKIIVVPNVLTEKELIEKKSIRYNQTDIYKNKDFIIDVTSLNKDILTKIDQSSVKLGTITIITRGFRPPPKELVFSAPSENRCKYILGKDLIDAFNIKWSGNFVKYDEAQIAEAKPINVFLQPKILIRDIGKVFNASYDSGEYLCLKTIYFIYDSKNCDLKYITGILNSKLMLFYFKSKFSIMHIQGGYLRFRKQFLEQLPMKITPKSQQQPLIKFVDKMRFLNKRLNEIGDKNTAETAKLKEEIQKTDDKIDELVYKIYGLNKKEIKIIEDSLKSN